MIALQVADAVHDRRLWQRRQTSRCLCEDRWSGSLRSVNKKDKAYGNKKEHAVRQGALLCLEGLTLNLGRLFDPYVVSSLPLLLQAFADPNPQVQLASQSAAKALAMRQTSSHSRPLQGEIRRSALLRTVCLGVSSLSLSLQTVDDGGRPPPARCLMSQMLDRARIARAQLRTMFCVVRLRCWGGYDGVACFSGSDVG